MPTILKLCIASGLLLGTVQAVAVTSPVPPGGFANCAQAYAAGYSNIPRSSPAYATRLDRDGDGVACER